MRDEATPVASSALAARAGMNAVAAAIALQAEHKLCVINYIRSLVSASYEDDC